MSPVSRPIAISVTTSRSRSVRPSSAAPRAIASGSGSPAGDRDVDRDPPPADVRHPRREVDPHLAAVGLDEIAGAVVFAGAQEVAPLIVGALALVRGPSMSRIEVPIQLLAGAAEQLDGGPVDVDDATLFVEQRDGVGGALEHQPEQPLPTRSPSGVAHLR